MFQVDRNTKIKPHVSNNKNPLSVAVRGFLVAPLGFEPRTRTLKVYCSTS
jgi:hypothetical protein